ncbi:hypothetical protein Acr_11g0005000 [Actinidia rufa]|uniref:Uncharacterized protein n=1 Tax=Actinidia rufa TaxID=165716 RepID=A0A7J0FBV3_9ERIC|nr:hypothetical protein Acr_11g0005000 [Actinidia rufa]
MEQRSNFRNDSTELCALVQIWFPNNIFAVTTVVALWCGWGEQVDHGGGGEVVRCEWGGWRTVDASDKVVAVMVDLGVAGDVGRRCEELSI